MYTRAVASFLLVLCQPGAERALKADVKKHGLTSSFQRPGVVTFKSAAPLDVDLGLPSVFARHSGVSLGKVPRAELAARLQAPDLAADAASRAVRRLHVTSTIPDDDAAFAEADALRAALLDETGGAFRAGEEPRPGELVATVVLVDGEPWLSLHRHQPGRSPFAGGRMRPRLPPEAPSRAWLKLEEATRVFGLPLAAGQQALELGSAPGGATRALLDRGLSVIGVDPNDMDPGVLRHPRFEHRRTTSMSLDPASLPTLHWILLDVNVPPRTALRGALPFVAAHARTLQGIVFTLKMKSWDIADEVEGWLRRIRRAAPGLELTARQLSTNGQEICVVGLRAPAGAVLTSRR